MRISLHGTLDQFASAPRQPLASPWPSHLSGGLPSRPRQLVSRVRSPLRRSWSFHIPLQIHLAVTTHVHLFCHSTWAPTYRYTIAVKWCKLRHRTGHLYVPRYIPTRPGNLLHEIYIHIGGLLCVRIPSSRQGILEVRTVPSSRYLHTQATQPRQTPESARLRRRSVASPPRAQIPRTRRVPSKMSRPYPWPQPPPSPPPRPRPGPNPPNPNPPPSPPYNRTTFS